MSRTVAKWLAILGLCLVDATVEAGEEPLLKTQKEKVSYELGVDSAGRSSATPVWSSTS